MQGHVPVVVVCIDAPIALTQTVGRPIGLADVEHPRRLKAEMASDRGSRTTISATTACARFRRNKAAPVLGLRRGSSEQVKIRLASAAKHPESVPINLTQFIGLPSSLLGLRERLRPLAGASTNR